MYIIAIAWLYVTVLMAAAETSVVAGALTFTFYGLLPLALLLWLFGTPVRRRRDLHSAHRGRDIARIFAVI
jgi:membrane protein implicated in regulation of membrane protease activity